MPRGVKNTPKPPPIVKGLAPLIIIQPGPDGTQFNSYDLDLPQVVDELRRTLVHLVANYTRIAEETDL